MSGEAFGPGLSSYLTEMWETEVDVEVVTQATTGARRANVLFDAVTAERRHQLVATIVPNREMLIQPIGVEASGIAFGRTAGMPAAEVVSVNDNDDPLGGPFFITRRVDGETMPRQILRMVADVPQLGPTIARQSGEAMALLHAADASTIDSEITQPEPGVSPAARALALAEEKYDGSFQKSPAIALGLNWLREHLPGEAARRHVIHGDFRNGNIMVGPEGLRLALDWEGCHIGDPMEDPAWLCVRMWRFRNDHLEVGGFSDRGPLVDGYEAAGGTWDEERFWWWKVLGTLRWGLGLETQAREHLAGVHSSVVMAASGRRVAELEYDLLMLLQNELSSSAR